ncbi:unnamed protein product [Effrenium voratum]|uniref:Uncharacterized protein n=1 Tax=Effrenium voratum TaxID=2562239 RepID=A0AA36ISY1_9DINO|nr:unnamed protein product [Effrenium voratum]
MLRACLVFPFLTEGQKGIGSLNDPCDCMQHHDFWVASRKALVEIFWTPGYPLRALDPTDHLHFWTRQQSCMYSPENEESHRPTALSDCIPGFLLVHIVCMQRHVAKRNPERALDFANELARLLPFGAGCLDRADGWPITSQQVLGYYRRFRRAFAAGPNRGAATGDAEARRSCATEREAKEETTSEWPTSLLQAGQGDDARQLGEEPDVCPAGTFPQQDACWLLGRVGASCQEACEEAAMRVRLREKTNEPEPSLKLSPEQFPEPQVPHIISAQIGQRMSLDIQHPWAPFECYVPEQSRFHLAATWLEQDPSWSYPLCALACPCAPVLDLQEVLEALPLWPS